MDSISRLECWAKKHLSSGSLVLSDGLACFTAVKDAGCEHSSKVTGGGRESVAKKEFICVNTMTAMLKFHCRYIPFGQR